MATIGTLVVNVQLNNQQFLTQINRTVQATQRATSQMARSASNVDKAFLLLRRTFLSFFAVTAVTRAVREVADYADAWKLATNQVAAANTISTLQARSMEGINEIAAKTRTSLAETAELYAKLLRSTVGVAQSEEEVAKATELVNKAFKAGGASMQEQVNGIRQLAQSLASGIFQGDELRSIRENAPLLAQAIATEFNTTIGGLKKLGAEGALTADRVFKAILKNSKPIEDAFDATNSTIAEAFTVLGSAITEYIGLTDKAKGYSKSFTTSILDLAKSLREAASAANDASKALTTWQKIRELDKATGDALQRAVLYVLGLDEAHREFFKGAFRDIPKGTDLFTAFGKAVDLSYEGMKRLDAQTKTFSEHAKSIEIPKLLDIPEFKPKFEGFGPATDEQEEFAKALLNTANAQQVLAEKAKLGKAEFERWTKIVDAAMDVAKQGINPLSDLGLMLVKVAVDTETAREKIEQFIATQESIEAAQRQVGQQKLLALALSISSEEYRKLKDHIDALNQATDENVDLSTAEGQARLALIEKIKAQEDALERLRERSDEVAATINSTVSSAISTVSSAFADAVVEGENFRDMLDSLLKDLAKLAINQVFQLFLKQLIGGVGTTGAPGSGLLGSVTLHGGGIVGSRVGGRSVPAAMFAGAPRLHSGGAFFGGAEFPAILKRGEGVFTQDQMKALGGGTQNNFTVINQAPNTTTTEDRQSNASGGTDITVFIRQAMTKEISDPASSVHKSLKSNFGLSQAGVRR